MNNKIFQEEHVVKKSRKRRKKTTNPTVKRRGKIFFILIFSTCLFCILVGRLFYIQVMASNDLTRRALKDMTKIEETTSDRGLIFDKNGKKLAVNISSSDIYLDMSFYNKKQNEKYDLEETLKSLSPLLKLSTKEIEEKLEPEKVNRIAKDLDRSTSLKIKEMQLPGVRVDDKERRYYPYNNLASHIIGFTNDDGEGLYGVETYYNEVLAGITGKTIGIKDSRNRSLPIENEKKYAPKEGYNLTLTLDETIQRIAEEEAESAKENSKAKKVSVLVQDLNTGEILAMTNKSDYNLNFPKNPQTTEQKEKWDSLSNEEKTKLWYDNWRNFSVNDLYEPGSTFKTITAAAALEEDVTTTDAHYYCTGYIRDIPGKPIRCDSLPNPEGDITMDEAFTKSCNTTFVRIGREVGKENLLKYIKGFGFGAKTGIDLPGEEFGIIPNSLEEISEVRLATISFGHGIAVTPIQLVNAISAIANGGNLMVPHVVKEITNTDGNPVKTNEPVVQRQVISKRTSEQMLELMEHVVETGTGTRAKVEGYRVGGKTGTANKPSEKGGYEEDKYISSFVGVAPINDPKYTVLVIVQEPEGDYYGSAVAAPAGGRIIEKILKYSEVPMTEKITTEAGKPTVVVPDVTNMLIGDAGKVITESGLKFNTESTGVNDFTLVTRQSPAAGVEVEEGTIIDLYLNPNDSNSVTMPILTGKTKEEVKEILDGLGIEYEIEGTGIVIEQSPAAGKVISWKNPVKIILAPPLHETSKNEESDEETNKSSNKNINSKKENSTNNND